MRRGCRRRLASVGFGRVAGCRHQEGPVVGPVFCRLRSGRDPRSCVPVGVGCGRWRVGSVARLRRSRGSLRRNGPAGGSSIGRVVRSGMPTSRPAAEAGEAREQRDGCAATCRIGSRARSSGRTELLCRTWGALDRSASRSPPGPALGEVVEPGADLRRLRLDFPDDESMRISHEAIYQALYVQGRGALRRELIACLRTGRALRVPRARTAAAASSSSAPRS